MFSKKGQAHIINIYRILKNSSNWKEGIYDADIAK